MNLETLAKELGFAACYVFPTESFGHYKRRLQDGALHSAGTDLIIDPKASSPWANAILALIFPYRPYADKIPVSGNYPSSNAAYHASNRLIDTLRADGILCERAYVPIRELLTRSGVGTPLKNGLTYISGFGTRYAVQTLFVSLPEPVFTAITEPAPARCGSCHACERICPSHAIDDNGYHFKQCARAYMGGDPMEDWVMDAMSCMLGCELCQKICPYNAGMKPIEEMPDAFRLEEILSGKIKPVLAIVGKNLNKNGRIIQHACVIAARHKRSDLIPLIERWENDTREGVRVAAAYALKKLQ